MNQIAAYGKGFVRASQDTWGLFEGQEIEPVVDSDMTSSLCFLTGVCSGSICVIMAAAWTFKVHQSFTATISLLVFFIGYLMVGSPYLTSFFLYYIYLFCTQITWSTYISWWENYIILFWIKVKSNVQPYFLINYKSRPSYCQSPTISIPILDLVTIKHEDCLQIRLERPVKKKLKREGF